MKIIHRLCTFISSHLIVCSRSNAPPILVVGGDTHALIGQTTQFGTSNWIILSLATNWWIFAHKFTNSGVFWLAHPRLLNSVFLDSFEEAAACCAQVDHRRTDRQRQQHCGCCCVAYRRTFCWVYVSVAGALIQVLARKQRKTTRLFVINCSWLGWHFIRTRTDRALSHARPRSQIRNATNYSVAAECFDVVWPGSTEFFDLEMCDDTTDSGWVWVCGCAEWAVGR